MTYGVWWTFPQSFSSLALPAYELLCNFCQLGLLIIFKIWLNGYLRRIWCYKYDISWTIVQSPCIVRIKKNKLGLYFVKLSIFIKFESIYFFFNLIFLSQHLLKNFLLMSSKCILELEVCLTRFVGAETTPQKNCRKRKVDII